MKKKILSSMILVILVATFSVAGTLAWLTDCEEVKNTFTIGNVDIVLDEAAVEESKDTTTGAKIWMEDSKSARVKENTYTGIYPGAVLPKDPTVTNTGSEPAYVRVAVTVNHWDILTASNVQITDLMDVFTVANDFDSTWKRVDIQIASDGKSATYIYEYIKDEGILAAGASTDALFKEVTVPALLTSEQMKTIGETLQMDIAAYAIQAQGFANADAAFTAYAEQNQ